MTFHFDALNLPRALCQRVLGKGHKAHHRMAVGMGVMFTGVMIAQGAHLYFEVIVIRGVFDLVGYTIHALGAVPFLEWLLEEHKDPSLMCGPVVCNGSGKTCETDCACH